MLRVNFILEQLLNAVRDEEENETEESESEIEEPSKRQTEKCEEAMYKVDATIPNNELEVNYNLFYLTYNNPVSHSSCESIRRDARRQQATTTQG